MTNYGLTVAELSASPHTMAEAYYSPALIHHGNYIAKPAIMPVSTAQQALAKADVKVDSTEDPSALRTATVGSEARQQCVEVLSFNISHRLEAHQPLGSIMRARLRVYSEVSRQRRLANK